MKALRKNPHIYEINLMTWLNELCAREHRNISLRNIPISVWTDLKDKGIDIVWLMGVWHRSKDACRRARNESGLLNECRSILEDFKIEDVVGSPYAIDRYSPDPSFGSEQDLMGLRDTLEDIGISLILDFVPNHTACDHYWVKQHPEYFVNTQVSKKGKCKQGFFHNLSLPEEMCIAHGSDPFYHPWTDTAQVNYCNPEAINAALNTLLDLRKYCHGLRCDMAMLVVKKVFQKTWSNYLKDVADTEFWELVSDRLKSDGRHCLMIAEVYWNMEPDLIKLGFDFTYDKTFYDLLISEDIKGLKKHLSASVAFQNKMVRFLENHDEPRAMSVFGPERIFCAMVIHATVPGMRFWHHGQFEGNLLRVPVQLRRAPIEPVKHDLREFSDRLLQEVDHPVFHDGEWEMCEIEGWQDNLAYQNLLAWTWRQGEDRRLIIVNFTSVPAQGLVKVPGNWLPKGETFVCVDPLKGDKYQRSTAQVNTSGLHVELEEWDFHFFRVVEG